MSKWDYIIVGQGIAGTVLHRKLSLAGKKVLIIDDNHSKAASLIAAGLINPITGRKYVKSWRIEDFLPVALKTYDELSEYLEIETYKEVVIHRALYEIKDENTWYGRMEDPLAAQYILENADTSQYDGKVDGVLSYGSLKGAQIFLSDIVKAYRKKLEENGELLSEAFDHEGMESGDVIRYKGHTAAKIVFAEGHRGMDNPYWRYLPWQPVKGEVLLVDIEGQPFHDIIRHKIFMIPRKDGLYWVGSGYEWDFENDLPTKSGGDKLLNQLTDILNVPFSIKHHIAGIRPAVKGRKPMLGVHPDHPEMYIFNGMGTKGSSLAPYWADHMVDFLTNGSPLDKDVDIK